MSARRQVDAHHGAEVLDEGPQHHGDRIPGKVGCWGEDGDVFEADDARNAGTVGAERERTTNKWSVMRSHTQKARLTMWWQFRYSQRAYDEHRSKLESLPPRQVELPQFWQRKQQDDEVLGDAKYRTCYSDEIKVEASAWLADVPDGLNGRTPENGAEQIYDILDRNEDDSGPHCQLEPPSRKHPRVEG